MTNGRGGSARNAPVSAGCNGSAGRGRGHGCPSSKTAGRAPQTDTGKAALRRLAKARRAEAYRRSADAAAGEIAEKVAALAVLAEPTVVAGYAAIRDELDVWPLLRRLLDLGHVCALPVVEDRAMPLTFRRWRPDDVLVADGYGIPTPLDTAPAVTPRVVLVPLVAFDRRGCRLGYGAGYYDRTLSTLRGNGTIAAVGVGFAAQEVDRVPAAATDQTLDWIVTEAEVIHS